MDAQRLRAAAALAGLEARMHGRWLLAGFDAGALKALALWAQAGGTENRRRLAELLGRLDAGAMELAWSAAFGLGSGSATPHESVYRTGLVMQEPRDEVRRMMIARGFLPALPGNEPEDHLGCEMLLLERLAADALEAA
ncbi:MAG: molecular chaperone TorD family protein, partial [Duodenibacillus sp.]|nr:molecular chaperone TorD family protein [Duodenibacillus sp.]